MSPEAFNAYIKTEMDVAAPHRQGRQPEGAVMSECCMSPASARWACPWPAICRGRPCRDGQRPERRSACELARGQGLAGGRRCRPPRMARGRRHLFLAAQRRGAARGGGAGGAARAARRDLHRHQHRVAAGLGRGGAGAGGRGRALPAHHGVGQQQDGRGRAAHRAWPPARARPTTQCCPCCELLGPQPVLPRRGRAGAPDEAGGQPDDRADQRHAGRGADAGPQGRPGLARHVAGADAPARWPRPSSRPRRCSWPSATSRRPSPWSR